MAKLNWIDVLFFGYRQIYDALANLLPERPAMQFAGSCTVADDVPNNRTVVTINGLTPDGSGGSVIGTAAGGWISVKSDGNGFRVYNSDESGFIITVDNNTSVVTIAGTLSLEGPNGAILLPDTSPFSPASGALIQSVSGAIRVAQHSPPSVTGSRGGNAALASLLTTLAAAGFIVNNTTP